MFAFLRKKKIINVDAFTNNPAVFEHHSIKSSLKFIPAPLKDMTSVYNKSLSNGISVPQSTIKSCPGIVDIFSIGYTIPLWSDCILETSENEWKYAFADGHSTIVSHDYMQLPNKWQNLFHLKFISPWLIQEKTGIKWLWIKNSWNDLDNTGLPIQPGIVEYKHQHSTHINILLNRFVKKYELTAGTPLIQLLPVTELNVNVQCHCIDNKEFEKIRLKNSQTFFTNNYRKQKKLC